ncbi:hypothetical protein M405DRAFT_834521 [Rhizopogon salebrosus TDB-379]|nr:hypothetical protein M405DRAFT_834521 [Rhizopogon salebrosus TDB-379]
MLLALASQHPGFCSVYCVVGRQIKDFYPGLLRLLRQEAGGERGNLAYGVDDAEMRLGCWSEGAGMAKRGE